MATLNFTAANPSTSTKLVGFEEVVKGGERTYELDDVRALFVADVTVLVGEAEAAVVAAEAQAIIATAKAAEAAAEVDSIEAFAVTATTQAGIATAQAVLADADRVQTGLDRVATAADRVATGLDVTAAEADRVATAADRVQTGLDRVATAADRVQTGLDRTAASASASSAASSASTALNALALQYKGGVSGASVPATSTLAGDYYEITTAGTSQSKTWAVGDRATYNGSSGSWTQTTGFFTVISSALTAYSPQGYLNSDGATANRAAGIQGPFDATNNPRGWVAGAATLTWRGVVTVPTSAGTYYVTSLSPTTVASTFLDNRLSISLTSSGALDIRQQGAPYSDNLSFQYSAFRSTYSAQTITLEVIWTQGTANPVVKVNEVDISASFTPSTAGTPPAWLDAAMVPTYHLTGYNWPAGPAPVGCWILGSLTDADRAFHRSTGQYPAWVVAGGSAAGDVYNGVNAASLKTETNATTSLNLYGAANSTASSVAGTRTGGAGSFFARFTATTSGSNSTIGIPSTIATKTGRRMGLSLWAKSSVSVSVSISLTENNSPGSDSAVISVTTSWQKFTYEFTAYSRVNFNTLFLSNSGSTIGDTLDVDDLQLIDLGALSLSGIQPCAVVDDLTTIGGNQARLVGVTPVTPKRDWRISADTWLNSNQRILEGALIDSTADIIDSIEQTTTGTPTVTIGSASAGVQYKASGALTAGINPTTLVTRKAASNEFWVGSNSTAVVRTTIKGHRAI